MELIPFVPPSRYTSRTPVVIPVLIKFVRFGAIAMLEWSSLRFIDHAPLSVWIITSVMALLILAVYESREWLNFKNPRYFPVSLIVLIFLWVGSVAFAYAYFGVADTRNQPPITTNPPPKPARSKQTLAELLAESGALLDIFEKTLVPISQDWASIRSQNPEMLCLSWDSRPFQEKMSSLSDRIIAARKNVEDILQQNRIDRAELEPLLGPPRSAAVDSPFEAAAGRLERLRDEIKKLSERRTCEDIVHAGSAPELYMQMQNAFIQFSEFIGNSEVRITNYRDALRKELRNAP
jgi:hypothetical protein